MPLYALNVHRQLIELQQSELDSLKSQLKGQLITPYESIFDEVRQIWNAMIDRKPAFIIRCDNTADVIKAVEFANHHNLLLSVRGAGHNIAGRALQDQVILIDLSIMREVKVDEQEKIAIASPGATLADVDKATQQFGLGLPLGINSTTGISGLTLGGGFGWLSRKLGLTADNLISVEIVTVKGECIIADEKHYSDLFWAIRGGGGNFGIVTRFTFKLHPIRVNALGGPIVFDLKEAKSVFKKYLQLCKKDDRDLTVWGVMRHAPPFPFIDKNHHGKPVLIMVFIYFGEEQQDKAIIEQMLALGTPIGHGIANYPFKDFQQLFDPMLTPGARNYWKTHNFKEISDELVTLLIDYAKRLPSEQSEVFIGQMGGFTNTVAFDATAYPHRDVAFVMNVHTRWGDANQDNACIAASRHFYQATLPFATGGTYVNFVSEGDDSLESTYGANTKRLKEIKTKYDPDNVLRGNMNIVPKNTLPR